MATILLILFSAILVMLVVMTYRLHAITHAAAVNQTDESLQEKTGLIQGWLYTAIVFTIIAIIASIYFMVKGTPWEGHLAE